MKCCCCCGASRAEGSPEDVKPPQNTRPTAVVAPRAVPILQYGSEWANKQAVSYTRVICVEITLGSVCVSGSGAICGVWWTRPSIRTRGLPSAWASDHEVKHLLKKLKRSKSFDQWYTRVQQKSQRSNERRVNGNKCSLLSQWSFVSRPTFVFVAHTGTHA